MPVSISDASDAVGFVKKIHGNSKTSTKASMHTTLLIKKGKVAKTGVSGGGVRIRDGKQKSIRAEQQVRAWNKEEGEGARNTILDYEKKS